MLLFGALYFKLCLMSAYKLYLFIQNPFTVPAFHRSDYKSEGTECFVFPPMLGEKESKPLLFAFSLFLL